MNGIVTTVAAWASIAGLVIAIVGLVYSVKAFLAADRAEKAAQTATQVARDAGEAVRRGGTAEDLEGLSVLAKELVAFVEDGRAGEAAVRAGDLLFHLAHVADRRQRFLRAKKIRELTSDLASIKQVLSADGIPTDAERREGLRTLCYNVLLGLRAESGRMLREIEEGDNA